ncbi:MAG: hybrid sensor histidine kinase/response regulator [Oligoflexales bacterium]
MRRIISSEIKVLLVSRCDHLIQRVIEASSDVPLSVEVSVCPLSARQCVEGQEKSFDVLIYDMASFAHRNLEDFSNFVRSVNLPVVAVSDEHSDDIGIQAILAGAQDFIRPKELDSTNIALKAHFTVARYKMQREVVASKNEVEYQLRTKSKFLAHLSHEIRGTLSAIVGVSGLLNESDIKSTYAEELDVLSYGSQKLLSTVNDILDVSKFENGINPIAPGHVLLSSIFDSVMKVFSFEARKRCLILSSSIAEGVQENLVTDGKRLQQILFNLVNNAVKYTESGNIHIQAESCSENSQHIRFSVRDTGRGLSEDFIPVMFNDYSQEQERDNRIGTGLGLGICRDFSALLGGEIGAFNNTSEKGCTFWFTIKHHLKDSAEEVSQPSFSHVLCEKTKQKHKPQVVVVDDDFLCQRVLSMQLKSLGCEVATFSSGTEVLSALNDQELFFEAIFVDCTLGDMTGVELTKELRFRELDCPIVGVSGDVSEENQMDCLGRGMSAFLPKPLEKKEVSSVLQSLLYENK